MAIDKNQKKKAIIRALRGTVRINKNGKHYARIASKEGRESISTALRPEDLSMSAPMQELLYKVFEQMVEENPDFNSAGFGLQITFPELRLVLPTSTK
jgi:hypothetical protein